MKSIIWKKFGSAKAGTMESVKMDDRGEYRRRRSLARRAGLLYLIFVIVSVIAKAIGRDGIIVSGDAATTAANILAQEARFRLGSALELLVPLLFFLTAWALYSLLKSVNRTVALLFLLLNACGGALYAMNALFLFAAIPFATGSSYLASFSGEQLQALASSLLDLHTTAYMGAQIFYGAWALPLGYLVYTSRFMPRIVGILLMLDCFSVWAWLSQYLLLPGYSPSMSYPFYAFSFVAEVVSLTLWLLIKGVSDTPAAAQDRRA